MDTSTREREKALADSHQHLLLTLKALGRGQASLQARDARIADLEKLKLSNTVGRSPH